MTSFAALRHNKVMRKIENGYTSRQKHCRLGRNKTLLLDNADEALSRTSQCIAESYDMQCKKETEPETPRETKRQKQREEEEGRITPAERPSLRPELLRHVTLWLAGNVPDLCASKNKKLFSNASP
jgi:hypothetical protein